MANNLFKSIKESIARYIQLRFIDVKLELIERLSNVMGYFTFVLVLSFLFFFAFLFFSFGLAAWLGEVLGNRYAGMFCTGGIILAIAIIVLLSSKSVIRFFSGKLAAILSRTNGSKLTEEDDEDV